MTKSTKRLKNKKFINTEKEKLELKLKELLLDESSQNGIVISIKGSWGIGKSFYWNEFAKKYIIENKTPCYKFAKNNINQNYAYISLFGKTSLEDIKQDIILQISTISKLAQKLKNKIGNTKLLGVDIGSSLSILNKSDFKDTIICFDDFERTSKSVDIKDVIGLISELKEQKNCKIIIINNNDQLKQNDELSNYKIIKDEEIQYIVNKSNNKETFDLFSEKIIDSEFCYCPTIEENFSLLKDQIKYFDTDNILNYLESTNKNDKLYRNFNIRLHKNVIKSLNIFSFLENENIDNEIKKALSDYICEKTYKNKTTSTSHFNANIESLYEFIDSALEKSFLIDEEEFLLEINHLQEKQHNITLYREIEELHDNCLFDLKYTNSDFEEQLFAVFNKNKNTIISCLGFPKLKSYIEILSKNNPNNKDKHEKFFIEVSKKHIDDIAKNKDLSNRLNSEDFKDNFRGHNEIITYLDEKIRNQTNEIKSDINKIIEQLNKPKKQGGHSPSDVAFLSSISIEEHMDNMKESKEYLYATFRFAQYSNSFSGSKPFRDTYNNILKAMVNLSKEKNMYKVKLEELITSLKGLFG